MFTTCVSRLSIPAEKKRTVSLTIWEMRISQSAGSTENVAPYLSRGAVEGLGPSAQANRVLAMVGISRSMDQYGMATERQGRPAAWSYGLPHVCVGDGVGGLGVAWSI